MNFIFQIWQRKFQRIFFFASISSWNNKIILNLFIFKMIKENQFLGQFEHEEYKIFKDYIDTEVPQIRLFFTKFTPPAPKYTICIIHGFGEHSTRFHPVADFYAKHQFEVLLVDLRGFGYSGGPRGAAEVTDLQNDVIHMLKKAREDLPLFLYAHSLGGLITIKLLLEKDELNISGCVITSPLLGMGKSIKNPWLKVQTLKLMGDGLSDFILNSKVNPTALTKKTKYLHTIFEDRMMLPFLCVNMAKSIFEALEQVNAKMNDFRYPIIIFHGKQDTVTSFEDSKRFVQTKMRPLKEFYPFENGYHELQHDVEKDQMLDRSLKFIEKLRNLKNFGQMRTVPIKKLKKKGSPIKWIILILIAILIILKKARTEGSLIANIIKKIKG